MGRSCLAAQTHPSGLTSMISLKVNLPRTPPGAEGSEEGHDYGATQLQHGEFSQDGSTARIARAGTARTEEGIQPEPSDCIVEGKFSSFLMHGLPTSAFQFHSRFHIAPSFRSRTPSYASLCLGISTGIPSSASRFI